jgi:flagellar biogenesis protein FliO
MALTGSLLSLTLLLVADPGAGGSPYGALRAPPPAGGHQAADHVSPPRELSPALHGAAGWSVSDAPRPLASEAATVAPAQALEDLPPANAAPAPIAPPPADAVPLQPHALKLAPPSKSPKAGNAAKNPPSAAGAMTSIVSSLAVVLGLFFLVVWLARRNGPKGAMLLPAEVLEVLGRAPLTSRNQMHVVRFGNKLLLLSISPGGAEPLAEIEDPAEVDRLAGICQELRQGSISETFRHVFSQFANEPAREGFVGAGRSE